MQTRLVELRDSVEDYAADAFHTSQTRTLRYYKRGIIGADEQHDRIMASLSQSQTVSGLIDALFSALETLTQE